MQRRTIEILSITSCILLFMCMYSCRLSSDGDTLTRDLETNFRNPPFSSGAYTWWHWMNGNITREGITLDLEAMKKAGIAGFQLFEAGSGIPLGPVESLSDEWIDLVIHAMNEAERLGLEFAMHNCPGWSSSGGPWITPEMSMQELTWTETLIEGGKTVSMQLPQPEAKLNYYEDAFVLAYPAPEVEQRLPGWKRKANFRNAWMQPDESQTTSGGTPIRSAYVLDISAHMDTSGRLNWQAPQGRWMILRLGHTAVGQQNHSAPTKATGLDCDKYSTEALDFHLEHMFGKLMPVIERFADKNKFGLLIDSYEMGLQNWTKNMPEEFQNYRGYELIQYLPAVTGRVVDDVETTEQFLWDFRRTHADLMADNYYTHFQNWCKKYNIITYTEPYGGGMLEEFQVGSRLDINMGEFWSGITVLWANVNLRRTVKLASSIAHINGQQVVGGESFTAEPESGKWQQYPFSMKTDGDWAFTQGLNRYYFHRFVHQPHPTARPGMTMGPWGVHFDHTNTWWEPGQAWLTYIARCQYMLQQGEPVADLLYCTDEKDFTNTLIPERSAVPPPIGYDYDLINTEYLNRAEIKNGKITLPGGQQYSAVIMPTDTILPEIITNGILKPDLVLTSASGDAPLGWIHRRVGDADIYFIANRRRTYEEVLADFRVGCKQPEIWDPDTGEITKQLLYSRRNGRTQVPLQLPPGGSVFVIFRQETSSPPLTQIKRNGETIVHTAGYDTPAPGKYPSIQNNFTITTWVKPETDIALTAEQLFGKNKTDRFAIFPPDGESLYGKGHATAGLTVGRNGVALYERTSGGMNMVLSHRQPIAGWIHLAIVYRNNKPAIYIDGKQVSVGNVSPYQVHPGVGEAYQWDNASYYNGDMAGLEVSGKPLNEKEIREISIQPLPQPQFPYQVTCMPGNSGTDKLLLWENGNYEVLSDSNDGIQVDARQIPPPLTVKGPWKVKFPPDSGAPDEISLDTLISLHRHPVPGVKYFSGTASWYNTLNINPEYLTEDYRLFLDLGRVEVLAELYVNDRYAGCLWKPPYMTDITALLRSGDNKIEIKVTNLWPNRLIGDEQLPEENEYIYHDIQGKFAVLHNGGISKLPDWYTRGEEQPEGGRVAFSTWKHYHKDSPLLESGLTGPVILHIAGVYSLKKQQNK